MDPNSRRGSGGTIGTLEAYCSTRGLLQTWQEIAGSNRKAMISEIYSEAQSNPVGAAAAAISKKREYLGYGLLNLANTVNPHAIITGGTLSTLGASLLDPAKRIFQQRALPGFYRLFYNCCPS